MTKKTLFRVLWISLPIIIFLIWMWTSDWKIFGDSGIRGEVFQDYETIRSYSQCINSPNGVSTYLSNQECWVGYNYGPIAVMLTGLLSSIFKSTEVVGWLMILVSTLTLLHCFVRFGASDLTGRIFQSLLLVTPGILLLHERANIDSLIFTFSYLVIFNLGKIKPIYILGSLMLIALIKFYTLPAAIFTILQLKISKSSKFLISLLLSSAVFFFAIPMYELVPYNWFLSFGSVMPFVYLDFTFSSFDLENLNGFLRISLGFFSIMLIFSLTYFLFPPFRKLLILSRTVGKVENEVLFHLGFIFATSFLFATNYDYRLVFLLPLLANYDRVLFPMKRNSKERYFFIFLTLFSLFFGSIYKAPYVILQGLQFCGDLGLTLLFILTFVHYLLPLLTRNLSNFK